MLKVVNINKEIKDNFLKLAFLADGLNPLDESKNDFLRKTECRNYTRYKRHKMYAKTVKFICELQESCRPVNTF